MSDPGGGGPPPERRWLGVAEAVTAASLWGTSGIFSVHLFRAGVTPPAVALLRPLLGLAVAVGVLAVARPARLRVDRTGLLVLAGGGGVVVALFQFAYQWSIDAVGVPATVALVFLAPALVVAASGPLLGEWPDRRRIGLAALVVAGVWLSVAGADRVASSFGGAGIAWGVLAGAGYAGYTLLGRWAAPRWGSAATLVYSTAGACALLAVALPWTGGGYAAPGDAGTWLLLLAYAVATIALAQGLFFDALRRTEASRVSIAAAAEPVVAAVLATVLLGQGLRPVGWLGTLLVVAGVAGVAVTRSGSR